MYIRRPAVAGSFYPADSEKLKKMICGYISQAEKDQEPVKGKLYGIISPHAGYIYSGPVAAYGFSYLKYSNFDGFVVIAPSHRARFNGASVLSDGAYSTPLGEMEIDSELGGELKKSSLFTYIKEIDEPEHSLEVQIPFIQFMKPGLKLVPVIIGTTEISLCRKIGEVIAEAVKSLNRNYAIVISTDLSHYYPYKKAVQMDSDFISALKSFDENRIVETVKSGKGEACGEGALLAGITAARKLGASKIEIAKYANSGDTAGSKDEVVGYVSAVILGEE